MAIDWSKVLKKHIEWACSRYDAGENRPTHPAINTFLIRNGKRYPAKFIRGLAYEIATGDKLSSDEYSGGMETVRFLSDLGFSVEYKGEAIEVHKPDQTPTVRIPDTATKKKNSSSGKMQKDFLIKLLKQRFGCVMTEAKFDWLKVPDRVSKDSVLDGIYKNLAAIRNYENFSTPHYPLACDFFIPSKNLIIEYDERQHFTEQRAKSLAHYPLDLNLDFDKAKWREACENTKAIDNDPEYRDEQRAFYDSVRDILAARNGMTLIRIKDGDCDWGSESGTEAINELINSLKLDAHPSDLEEAIEELAWDFSCVQKAYWDWAKQFKNQKHEDVISWLRENNIGEWYINRCQKQDKLDMLSSNWNPITIPILYLLVPDCMARMKDQFDKLFQNPSKAQIVSDPIWYSLFFIHPVRHELYYFDLHYPNGYSFRLAKLVRSHRLGLKSAKTYLGEEGRAINGSHISACGTVAFKHLHLHPTMSGLDKPDSQNLKAENILKLEIGDGGELSDDEQELAINLSARATMNFERWIGYAPCAINEGPIFTLKEGKKHSDCFEEIIEILQGTDQTHDTMRTKLKDTLKEYYEIEVSPEVFDA
jgi:very-short-patch-repair endonuclease